VTRVTDFRFSTHPETVFIWNPPFAELKISPETEMARKKEESFILHASNLANKLSAALRDIE